MEGEQLHAYNVEESFSRGLPWNVQPSVITDDIKATNGRQTTTACSYKERSSLSLINTKALQEIQVGEAQSQKSQTL